MKLAALLFFFFAAAGLHFDITDARGKKPGGITVEAAEPDADGWQQLKVVTKGKGHPVLVWPFDGRAKAADGPGDIPVIVMEPGESRALANTRLLAAVGAGELLGTPSATGLDAGALAKALSHLAEADEAFAKGVGLLYLKKPTEAAEPLGRALRERERQLTRVPSEVYPAAVLYGRALLEAQKFDEAAVAFLKALKQRPSDPVAAGLRAEALAKAGKPEAQ
jgi:tetratricopeptide (TPR) repeat protein